MEERGFWAQDRLRVIISLKIEWLGNKGELGKLEENERVETKILRNQLEEISLRKFFLGTGNKI